MASQRNHLLSIFGANAPKCGRIVARNRNSAERRALHAGEPVEHVYWPHTGVASLVIRPRRGRRGRSGNAGISGVCGAAFALNNHPAVHIAVVLYREANTSRIGFY